MENKVVLDFSKCDYSDAAPYDEQSLIHRSKMRQIMRMWDQLYDNAIEVGENTDFHRFHSTSEVFASRGAGKTTFLLSFLYRIKRDKGKDILCLSPIDPSLIETKQHPFINILAAIQECVENALNENYYSVRDKRFEEQKKHADCYNDLLKALPFIDGIGKDNVYDGWDDEEFISIQGMNKAKAFNNLEERFHIYIRETLKLLDKKCIVIPFDDIDTDFKKGFEILEVLRKYITSGQIITILTGDLELYSKLVRKANWKCFDDDFLKKEMEYAGHRKEEFAEMIDQLENQYLIKLLKPEYRIHLKTIREYLEEDDYSLEVIYTDTKKGKAIVKCYKDLLNRIGISSGNERINTEICHFLLGLSLRGQVRILTLLNFNSAQKEKMDITTGLLNVFANDINQKAANTKLLINGTPVYTIEMLKFLIHANALYTGSNFLPETNDDILNKALFAVGTKFNQLVRKNRFLIFDYWIRLSYIEVLSERLGGKLSDRSMVRDLLEFSQLNANINLLKSVGLAQAFCNSKLNRNKQENVETMAGTIFIGNNAPVLLSESNQVLSMLPMLGTIDTRQHENVFLSVYRLLAIIRETLFYSKNNGSDSLEEMLSKEAPYSNFLQPFFLDPVSRKEGLANWNDVTIDIKEDDLWTTIIRKLKEWSADMSVEVSTSLLYHIFIRFYNTMLQIDEDDKYRSAGMKFNAYIVALLNAALVEEMAEYGIPNMNFNVIGDIETIYIHNRKAASSKMTINGKTDFYKWLSECPLLEIFLNPFLKYLMQNDIEEKEQYLNELLKYDQMNNKLALLLKKQENVLWKLKRYNGIQEWIKYFIQLKEVEEKLSTYNTSEFLLPGEEEEFQQLLKEKQTLRKKTKNIIKVDELEVLLHNGMDEMQVDFIKDDISNKMSETKLGLRELFNEINLLKGKIKNVADFVKANYESLHQSDSPVFAILNAIYI